jgi:hypothetical protein
MTAPRLVSTMKVARARRFEAELGWGHNQQELTEAVEGLWNETTEEERPLREVRVLTLVELDEEEQRTWQDRPGVLVAVMAGRRGVASEVVEQSSLLTWPSGTIESV